MTLPAFCSPDAEAHVLHLVNGVWCARIGQVDVSAVVAGPGKLVLLYQAETSAFFGDPFVGHEVTRAWSDGCLHLVSTVGEAGLLPGVLESSGRGEDFGVDHLPVLLICTFLVSAGMACLIEAVRGARGSWRV